MIRHAQTHSSQYYKSDKERELKPEGIIQAAQVGKHLCALNYTIDLIISSDAARAKTTALLVASEIEYPAHKIQLNEKIYSGTMRDVLELLQEIPDSVEHVLLIGHYPTIVELNNYLSDSQKSSMETCELTVLTFATRWSELVEGTGALKLNYHPSY